MTKVITASKARAQFFSLINETATSHEPIIITGKHHNTVMISQEDWNAIHLKKERKNDFLFLSF